MQDIGRSGEFSRQIGSNDQLQAIFLQIQRAAANMHHIDELLSWLSQMAASYLNVPIVQIWARQANRQRQVSTLLRSMAFQDIAFPQNFFINPQIVAVIERLMQGQGTTIAQSVEMIFPQPVAILLKRHKLNYCACSFLSGEMLLPPPTNVEIPQEQVATPLMMVMLLLSKQAPTQDFLQSLDFLFKNTLSVAINRGLLLPATAASTRSSGTNSSAQNLLISLSELVPHRVEDVTSSPLVASGADLDRSLRRVYTAINGRRNIVELSRMTKSSVQDVISVLKSLAALGRIELYGSDGHPVDSSLLPDHL
jgi:hypothetical protein